MSNRSKRADGKKAFEWTREGFRRFRVRCGTSELTGERQQLWLTIRVKDEAIYEARRGRLEAIAGGLTAKGLTDAAKIILRKAAEAVSNEAFEACCERAGAMMGGASRRERKRRWHTFEEFATAYYTGALAREYPAHCKVKKTIDDDRGKLRFLCELVGDIPIEHFTVEHAMLAMKRLPPTCKRDATRNHYWQVMHRLLELAAFPAGLIGANPLMREHRPDMTDNAVHYPFMYPLDDFKMLRYSGEATSEGLRLDDPVLQSLFGTGNREGTRLGELLRKLTWPGIDPVYGRLNVGIRKNGRVGSWPAQPGTIETLLALRTAVPGLGDLPGPFFGLPDDGQWSKRFRKLLEVSGCREELYRPPSDGRAAIRAYDTRATFVTLAKAFDLPEPYIMRRTGHEHSTMLARYDHARDDWRDHDLGKLVRLDVALGRERLGLGPLDLVAEMAARVAPAEGDDDEELAIMARFGLGDGVLDPQTGRAIRLESRKVETGHETERRFLVRMTVPEKWKSSMFSAVPKPGVEPGRGGTPADFESLRTVHDGLDGGLNPRNHVAPPDPKAPRVSLESGQVRRDLPPAERLLEALREARHAAVDADDDEAVEAIGALIKARRAVADRERFVAELVAQPPPTEAERELARGLGKGRGRDRGDGQSAELGGPQTTPPASLDEARRRRRGD